MKMKKTISFLAVLVLSIWYVGETGREVREQRKLHLIEVYRHIKLSYDINPSEIETVLCGRSTVKSTKCTYIFFEQESKTIVQEMVECYSHSCQVLEKKTESWKNSIERQ